jgi:hypothetical protein
LHRNPDHPEELIRKIVFSREEVLLENGTAPLIPAARGAAAAVVVNPWAGLGPEADLSEAAQWLAPAIARALIDRLLAGLGGPDAIEAFGKGAIVGTGGEIEHGGALIHTPFFGNLLRESLEGTSIICFADSRGDAGESLVVPMWHKTAAATRSHYQTVDIRIPDAPRADEIVIVAAASSGPRPHARIGDRKTDAQVSWSTLVGAGK